MVDVGLIRQLAILIVLLLLSAFFSGSETAYFSLNSLEKDSLRRKSTRGRGRFVQTLFSRPDEVLVAILTGNMFVNISGTSISEAIGDRFLGQSSEILSIVAMTLLLLLVGEMTPKNLAIRHSLSFSHFSIGLMRYYFWLSRPVVVPLSKLRHWFVSLYPRDSVRDGEARSSAVLSAIRMGYQNKTIEHSELVLLERFFRFRERTAADVMVPRIDAETVEAATTVSELLNLIDTGEFDGDLSLIPVMRIDVDHIVGYVRRSDLIPFCFSEKNETKVSELVRSIHAVPASKPLRELINEMREHATEMVVVVDEYGGTEGVVSFSSIVDYLFNEFRPAQQRFIEQLEEETYRISGSAESDEVAEVLDVELDTTRRTVAGMIVDKLGELPHAGSEVEISGYLFRVTEVRQHRIVSVHVSRVLL